MHNNVSSCERFEGRDRRLYFNKAVIELSMGHFDEAIKTCKFYIKPVKKVLEELLNKNEAI